MAARRHPRHDEDSHGGLGQIYFRLGRYHDAYNAFTRALECCSPEGRCTTRFNQLGAQILAKIGTPNLSVFDARDPGDLAAEELTSVLQLEGAGAHHGRALR